jgi:thiol-disulfide isomerase/thioredoxin
MCKPNTIFIYSFFIFIILSLSKSSFCQKAIIIIKTDNNEYAVRYVLPLHNTYNFSINEEESLPQNNTLILKTQTLTQPCFASINYGQKGKLYFILSPNDTIEIKFNKNAIEPYSKKDSTLEWVEIKGFKSDLHSALNRGILQMGQLSKRFKADNFGKKMTTVVDYSTAIDAFLNKQLIIIDSLCTQYHASDEFRKTANASVISQIIAGVEMNVSGSFFDGVDTQQQNIHDELRIVLFEKYRDKIYSYLEQIPLGLVCFQQYLWQSEGNKLDDSNDQSYIIPVNNDYTGRRVFQLFPKNFQQSLWAGEIIAHHQNYPNSNIMNMAIAKYSLQYPDSPYISILNRKLNFKEVRIPNYSFIDTTATSNDFSELINNNLPNFNSYFFVDLWATWCGGCKIDFRKYHEILPFLKENNIKCLFVSIDDKEKNDLWKSMVNGFMMEGYHTRANLQFRQFLDKKIFKGQVSIPRYFLIDNKGKIVKQFEEGLINIPLLKQKIKKAI